MHSGAIVALPSIAATDSENRSDKATGHLSVIGEDSNEAEQKLLDALADLDAQPAGGHLAPRLSAVSEMLAGLAERYARQGDIARAEVLYLRAIRAFRHVLPTDHPLIALSRDNLAGLYKARRQY